MRKISFIPLDEKHYNNLKDESRLVGFGEWIGFPKSEEELENLIIEAKKNNLKLTIQGSRTGIVGGGVPEGGAVIELSMYNSITGFRKNKEGDFFLLLDAGVTLKQLEVFLAQRELPESFTKEERADYLKMRSEGNFHFPPNPSEDSATFGGIYATNASGSNKLGYGETSKYFSKIFGFLVDGTKFMLCEDEIKIMKENTSEISLKKPSCLLKKEGRITDLLSGSEGSLFIISKVEIKLIKTPTSHWGIHYFFEKRKELFDFSKFIQDWKKSDENNILLGCEYYDEKCLDLIKKEKSKLSALKEISDFPKNARESLFVELGGYNEEQIEEVIYEHFEGFLEVGGKEEDTWAVDEPSEVKKFHVLRHTLPELINMQVDIVKKTNSDFVKIGLDFTGPEEKFINYADMYSLKIKESGIEGYVFGHILENHYHVNLLPKNEEEVIAANNLVEDLAKIIVRDGGKLVTENGIGRVKKNLFKKHTNEDIIKAVKEVKAKFDSENRLGLSF